MVGQWTTGLSGPWTGLGKMAAALAARATLLLFFLAGWLNHVLTWFCHALWKCWLGIRLLCLGIALDSDRTWGRQAMHDTGGERKKERDQISVPAFYHQHQTYFVDTAKIIKKTIIK
jgi:protein-S-isoprenylcysteine O-methyltransferase Ste14